MQAVGCGLHLSRKGAARGERGERASGRHLPEGLTPTPRPPHSTQVIPVYSLPEDGDALLRGYTSCPAYDQRLRAFYASAEFLGKSAESAALRANISVLAPAGLSTDLTNWWNVYDGEVRLETCVSGQRQWWSMQAGCAAVPGGGRLARSRHCCRCSTGTQPYPHPTALLGRHSLSHPLPCLPWYPRTCVLQRSTCTASTASATPCQTSQTPTLQRCRRWAGRGAGGWVGGGPPLNDSGGRDSHPHSHISPLGSRAPLSSYTQLANWCETAKMRSNLTGSLLGGLLLSDLLGYLSGAAEAASAASSTAPFYQLVHLSAHYNTILGVLGALAIDQVGAGRSGTAVVVPLTGELKRQPTGLANRPDSTSACSLPAHRPFAAVQMPNATAEVPWLSAIPSLASIMAFELHADTALSPSQLAVRLVAQDGPAADYAPIPLPCAVAGGAAEALAGQGACSLADFVALAQGAAINGTESWCSECQNTAYTVCQLAAANAQLKSLGSSNNSSSSPPPSAGSGAAPPPATGTTATKVGSGGSSSSASLQSRIAAVGIAVGAAAALM